MKFLACLVTICSLASSTLAQEMYHAFVDRDLLSVSQSELQSAANLAEIHERYPEDWVDSYLDTKIQVTEDGQATSAMGNDGNLTPEQKQLIKQAKVGSELKLYVKYMPKNNLKNNTKKEMDFSYNILPAQLPEFNGGEDARQAYVDQAIISKLTPAQKEKLDLARVQFTITPDGSIHNPHILESSGDEDIDQLLLQAFEGMPAWLPARKIDGSPIDHAIKFFISKTYKNCLIYGSD